MIGDLVALRDVVSFVEGTRCSMGRTASGRNTSYAVAFAQTDTFSVPWLFVLYDSNVLIMIAKKGAVREEGAEHSRVFRVRSGLGGELGGGRG